MQPYQTLSPERLAALTTGTKLKLGTFIIKFIRRGVIQCNDGHKESFVEYIDSQRLQPRP